MPRYRTRPREIIAYRWMGGVDFGLPYEIERFTSPGRALMTCHTKQGPVHAVPGDWLILGDQEVYPCKPDEFEKRYEPIPEKAADAQYSSAQNMTNG